MQIGELVDIDKDTWECISGGLNIVVLQRIREVKIPKEKKDNLYYLKYIEIGDLPRFLAYCKTNGIPCGKNHLCYIGCVYLGMSGRALARVLGVSETFVSRSKNKHRNSAGYVAKVDSLAKSLGNWKYKTKDVI